MKYTIGQVVKTQLGMILPVAVQVEKIERRDGATVLVGVPVDAPGCSKTPMPWLTINGKVSFYG